MAACSSYTGNLAVLFRTETFPRLPAALGAKLRTCAWTDGQVLYDPPALGPHPCCSYLRLGVLRPRQAAPSCLKMLFTFPWLCLCVECPSSPFSFWKTLFIFWGIQQGHHPFQEAPSHDLRRTPREPGLSHLGTARTQQGAWHREGSPMRLPALERRKHRQRRDPAVCAEAAHLRSSSES